jgi:hypothetical protein
MIQPSASTSLPTFPILQEEQAIRQISDLLIALFCQRELGQRASMHS